jgi:hypothetical protein
MGFIEEDPTVLDPAGLGSFVGPCVHLMRHDCSSHTWHGTVLIACHANLLDPQGTVLTFSSNFSPATDVRGDTLCNQSYGGADWVVLRCDPGGHERQVIV